MRDDNMTTSQQSPSGTRARRLDADLLSSDEIDLLLRACSKRAPTGLRNRALVATLYRSGLRLGEALALAPKDLDLQQFTITVQHGKNDKHRIVGVDLGTGLLLDQRLASRKKLQVGARAPLFCTLGGGEIDQSYVRHLLPRLAKRAGIEKRVHAHALRHAFAVDLVRTGAPIYTVRDALGHSSISTTNVYLSRVGAHEVVTLMKEREWNPA
jgi:site-specific recombinase XerD